MNWSDLNLMPAMPEIVLLALLGVVLLADLWICDKNRYLTHLMSLGTVIIVAVTQLAVWEQGSVDAFPNTTLSTSTKVSCFVSETAKEGVFSL